MCLECLKTGALCGKVVRRGKVEAIVEAVESCTVMSTSLTSCGPLLRLFNPSSEFPHMNWITRLKLVKT